MKREIIIEARASQGDLRPPQQIFEMVRVLLLRSRDFNA
jgi:hypothetical protein